MLTAIVLRDRELAGLTRHELVALEYLLHERFSEVARLRRSTDSALLLAIRAADYLAALLDDLGDDGTTDLLRTVADSRVARTAFERCAVVAELTAAYAA